MIIQPYLFFEGRCEEALAFYQKAIGAKIEMMMRNKESPEPPPPGMLPPGTEGKIMHSEMRIGDSLVMASDGMCSGKMQFEGIFLSITLKSEADADRTFATLNEGGEVLMPLGKTFFSPRFGIVKDPFGVSWMIYVEK